MHIETICPNCRRKLRVGVEHAGKQARCPVCNAVYEVPDPEAARPRDPADQWKLQTPEGQEYGPVSRETLERWVAEGRVSDDCRLCCEADGIWRNGGDVYEVLRPAPIGVTATIPWYTGNNDPPAVNAPDTRTPHVQKHVTIAHRGGIILAMAILSWAIGCPIFGVLAWVMGSNDLLEMRQGTMDTEGRSLTEAGRLIGMLHTFLCLALIIIGLISVLILRLL